MAEILSIQWKTQINQSINKSINQSMYIVLVNGSADWPFSALQFKIIYLLDIKIYM